MKNSTINYYDLNAQKYAESTINVKISESLEMFCKNLPEKARVLDVGCGSGRDSLYFKSKGFNVTAIDASAELAKFASKQIGQEVLIRDVKDLGFKNEFDAVWCMASLLHLKKDELPLAIKNCIQSLKVEEPGFFFASFKIGNGSGYDENGRFFSYYQKEELKEILENTQYFEKIQFQENEVKLGRNEVSWISFVAQKKPNLILDYNIKNKFK